jgi:glycine hydroxymethyltransferase
VDLRGQKLTGKEADRLLGEAHITVNKNSIPNDPESPFVTSGIRIGTPAITTRGLKEKDAIEVVNFIADVLDNPGNEEVSLKVKTQVSEMMKKFPVYKR